MSKKDLLYCSSELLSVAAVLTGILEKSSAFARLQGPG